MKVAVVEFNLHHDEILPSIVYALNELGVEPDVYVRVRAARRNAFAWAPRLRYRLETIDATTTSGRVRARIRGTPSRFRRYDALVMNSIEPADVLDAAARIDLPTVAIVHNADQLGADARYARFLADPSRRPMFLAPHIAASVGSAPGQDWLAPVYFGEVDEPDPSPDDRTTLCVQGNVQFIRRDYATFLAALEMLAHERTDFKVRIVGRSHWKDGRELRAQIDALGLSDRFVFTPPEDLPSRLPEARRHLRLRPAAARPGRSPPCPVLQRQDDELDVDVHRTSGDPDRGGEPGRAVRRRRGGRQVWVRTSPRWESARHWTCPWPNAPTGWPSLAGCDPTL